jgi:predicted MFS family arabinose efflux permease
VTNATAAGGAPGLRGFLQNSHGYKWWLAATLLCVSAVNYADRTSITSVYALLKRDFGFDDVAIGALGSLFLWSYALASPFAGRIGDRFRRGRVVMWSLAGWSLVTLLTGFAANRWQLLTLRTMLGLVEALYLPAAMALVAEYHDQKTRGTATGLVGLGNYLGMIGGGSIGGYLGQHFGWRSPLIVLGLVGLGMAAGCAILLPANERREDPVSDTRSEPLELFRIPSFLVLASAGLLTSIGTWIFVNWLPLYFRENFQMGLATAGFWGSSLVSIGAVAGQAGGGVLSDRFARGRPRHRMLLHAILIATATPVLLIFLVTRNQTLIMCALVTYSLFRTAGDANIIPLIYDISGPGRRSVALGIANMLNTVAGGLGVFAAGYLKSGFGLAWVFACLAGIVAFDAAMLLTGYCVFLKRDLERASVPG